MIYSIVNFCNVHNKCQVGSKKWVFTGSARRIKCMNHWYPKNRTYRCLLKMILVAGAPNEQQVIVINDL